MKSISLGEALLVLSALEAVEAKLSAKNKFEIEKVRYVLKSSIELIKPLLTGDKEKDQWAQEARTLPFEPLVFENVFCEVKRMKPQHFKALKTIC